MNILTPNEIITAIDKNETIVYVEIHEHQLKFEDGKIAFPEDKEPMCSMSTWDDLDEFQITRAILTNDERDQDGAFFAVAYEVIAFFRPLNDFS